MVSGEWTSQSLNHTITQSLNDLRSLALRPIISDGLPLSIAKDVFCALARHMAFERVEGASCRDRENSPEGGPVASACQRRPVGSKSLRGRVLPTIYFIPPGRWKKAGENTGFWGKMLVSGEW